MFTLRSDKDHRKNSLSRSLSVNEPLVLTMLRVLTVESDFLDQFWHKDVHRSSHTAPDVCGTASDVT